MSEQTTQVFDPFQAAFEADEQRKKEAENAKNNSGNYADYEEVKWLSLDLNSWIAFRPLGVPWDFRTESWHPKMILQSKIVKDDKSNFSKINWPYVLKGGKYVADPDWILSKLYNKVMEASWVKYSEADIDPKNKIGRNQEGKIVNAKGYDSYRVDKYSTTQIYQLINFNKKSTQDKSMNAFKPSFKVVMNIISRMDDWCKVNKHTMLLSTKVGYQEIVDKVTGNKTTINFPQTGISKSMYDEFIHYTQRSNNRWDVDFAIHRYQDSQDMYKNDYTDAKLRDRNDASIRDLMTDVPLTTEELGYEKYDIDKITQITSYQKLLNHHKGLFKLFDMEFNQSLTEELIHLADEEKRKYEEDHKNDKKESVIVDKTISSEIPKVEERSRGSEISKGSSPEESLKSIYPFWDKISKEDKDDILSYFDKIENVEVIWKPNTALIPCDECKTILPKSVMHCPKCDKDYN